MSENKKNNTFEDLYIEQKKRNSVLMTLVVVLAITTIGGLGWGFSKSNTDLQGPPSGFQGPGGQGFPGGSMGQMNFDRFFKDDGSVDTEAVQDMVDRLPSGAGSDFIDRFSEGINQAAEDGDITQAQADELINAFETAGDS